MISFSSALLFSLQTIKAAPSFSDSWFGGYIIYSPEKNKGIRAFVKKKINKSSMAKVDVYFILFFWSENIARVLQKNYQMDCLKRSLMSSFHNWWLRRLIYGQPNRGRLPKTTAWASASCGSANINKSRIFALDAENGKSVTPTPQLMLDRTK